MRDRVLEVIKDTLVANEGVEPSEIANKILDNLRDKNIMVFDSYDHYAVNVDGRI